MTSEAKILIFNQAFEGLWLLYCCLLQNQFVVCNLTLCYWFSALLVLVE